MSSETNIRVQMVVGLLALEELETLELSFSKAVSPPEKYRIMKRASIAFLRLANYVSSDALTDEEKVSNLFTELLANIKTYVCKYYFSPEFLFYFLF